jgi:cobalt-zinc-cadmium efflux system membrane fusion protein
MKEIMGVKEMTMLRVFLAHVLLVAGGLGVIACKGDKPPEKTEEKEHGEGHEEGVVRLTAEQIRSAAIATAKAEVRTEVGLLEATAQIEPAGDRQARVGSRIAGRIVAVRAGVGDRVSRGAVLATVDSPEVGRAKADYISALAAERVASESSERERKLFERQISSEKDWKEAQGAAIKAVAEKDAAENRLHALGTPDDELARVRSEGHYSSTLSVPAPITGVVVERAATLGQMVDPASILFVIMDLSQVWILVDVYERDIAEVRAGQNVRVKVTALGAEEFKGKVQSVGSLIETATRTAKARIVLSNPKGALRPGMFASVVFEGSVAGQGKPAVFVPSAAVQRDGEKYMVFVQKGPNEFEAREVTIGHESEGWREIEKGLKAGETVVTTGSFVLKSELMKAGLGEEGH